MARAPANLKSKLAECYGAKVRLSYCFTVWLALGSHCWSVVGCLSPCQKYLINPYNAIFLKSQWSKDIKNDILDCQIHKYTNTKTQMHKYTVTKCRKYPTCVYFQKARDPRTSKMIFWTVKNTNTHEMRLLRTYAETIRKTKSVCAIVGKKTRSKIEQNWGAKTAKILNKNSQKSIKNRPKNGLKMVIFFTNVMWKSAYSRICLLYTSPSPRD